MSQTWPMTAGSTLHPGAGESRALSRRFRAKLPVVHVVQQRGERDDVAVGAFALGQGDGRLPDALDVPPAVTRAVVGQ
jgi:hypothetical protein